MLLGRRLDSIFFLFVVISLLDDFEWHDDSATSRSKILLLASGQNNKAHPFEADDLSHCLPVDHRVCLDEETRRCESNYLKRPTITLAAGTTESSVYIAWVAQILLSEKLKFPTWLNGDGLGSHNFYEEGAWRMNQPRKYNFDAIINADKSPSLSCNITYVASLPVPDGLTNEPVCQVSCHLYSHGSSRLLCGIRFSVSVDSHYLLSPLSMVLLLL
jgi:hypothetical protein